MINRMILTGRLGADPEKTTTTTGKTVVRFSVPLHNPFAREGEKTEWMQCEVWNKPAEFIAQYGTKGSLVAIEGRLRNQRYETKEGEVRYRTYISVDNLRLLDSRNRVEGAGTQSAPQPNSQNTQRPSAPAAPVQKPAAAAPKEESIDDLFADFDFGN